MSLTFDNPRFNRYDEDRKYRRLVMWTEHNEHIPKEYLQRLKVKYGKNKNLARAHLYGEFCNLLEGTAYPDFDEHTHHVQKVGDFGIPNSQVPIRLSFDWNVSPLAWVALSKSHIHIAGRRLMRYMFHGESSGKHEQIGDSCVEFAVKYHPRHYAETPIYLHGDATGKKRDVRSRGNCFDDVVNALKELGYRNVTDVSPRSNPLVPSRVAKTNALFYESFIIIDPSLKNLIRSYTATTWKKGTLELYKPASDTITHWSDAADYVLFDLSESDLTEQDLPTIIFQ